MANSAAGISAGIAALSAAGLGGLYFKDQHDKQEQAHTHGEHPPLVQGGTHGTEGFQQQPAF